MVDTSKALSQATIRPLLPIQRLRMSSEGSAVHKCYLVTGRRQYRWHQPGTVFEATLDPDAERRAIERGSIQVLEEVTPSLRQGSYRLPNDQSDRAEVPNRDALSGSRAH